MFGIFTQIAYLCRTKSTFVLIGKLINYNKISGVPVPMMAGRTPQGQHLAHKMSADYKGVTHSKS